MRLGSLTGDVFGSALLGTLGVEVKSTKLGSLSNDTVAVTASNQARQSYPAALGGPLDDLLADPFSAKNLLILGVGGFLVWKYVLKRK